ncbi:MAG TPA: phosphopentomutase [Gemmatimonadaceae bacterium]
MSEPRRAIILILDGVGCGAAPDAAGYGDAGSDTLGNLARAVGGLDLPNLERLGLGRIAPLAGVSAVNAPGAAWGRMLPRSSGKDSTTGHWEIAGVLLKHPLPTWPDGFPKSVIAEFARRTGRDVLGNIATSGTEALRRFGDEHRRTGAWIVYTSADSVFQVAAHESVVPLAELYAACEAALAMRLPVDDGEGPLVGRAIARPFVGEAGAYTRTANRRDFSLAPPGETMLDALAAAGIARAGVGKVDDLFAGRGIQSKHTASNAEGVAEILSWLEDRGGGLLFANLVDFDQQYGHRNDAPGFYMALREFDAALPELLSRLRQNDLLFITADHGNDPTTPSTDHARECVPLLAAGPAVVPIDLGVRETFADLGATVAHWLGSDFRGAGVSFLPQLLQS